MPTNPFLKKKTPDEECQEEQLPAPKIPFKSEPEEEEAGNPAYADIPIAVQRKMGIISPLTDRSKVIFSIFENCGASKAANLDYVMAELYRKAVYDAQQANPGLSETETLAKVEVPDRAKTNQHINNTLVKKKYLVRVEGKKGTWKVVES